MPTSLIVFMMRVILAAGCLVRVQYAAEEEVDVSLCYLGVAETSVCGVPVIGPIDHPK
jgi:hypothetical protein